jgi:N-acetylneuraminate synthase/N,N'-diacetyllegionaminate synthase
MNDMIHRASPALIIAEAGVNHNGRLDLAKKLVDAAKEAGAGAVKFQTFQAEKLVTRTAVKANYQVANMGTSESQLEMLKKLELPPESYRELSDYCRSCDIRFLATPYGFDDLEVLRSLDVFAVKIASAMVVEPDFLIAAARLNKTLLLATGMATLSEVARSVELLTNAVPEVEYILLQCTTDYPADPRIANLRAMQTMANAFHCRVGYSDHTPGVMTGVMAVALGACVVERHLTLDKTLPGPDHAASSDPAEFAQYVRAIREAEAALGDGIKRPGLDEMRNTERMRRSLVADRAIKAGERIQRGDLTFKRPATGIAPGDMERVIGCRAATDIAEDATLQWNMIVHD